MSKDANGKEFLEARDKISGREFLWDGKKNFPYLLGSTQLKESKKELNRLISFKAATIIEENHEVTSLTKSLINIKFGICTF